MLNEKTVKDVVAKELSVTPDRLLPFLRLDDDLGVDSVDRLGLAVRMEDRFGIDVSDDSMRDAETVGDLVEMVAEELPPHGKPNEQPKERINSMSAFAIAKKDSDLLETPIFRAGQDGVDEAVAVFTTREAAQQYISDAGWSSEYEVGELVPIELVRWLTVANKDGADMVVVDPSRDEQLEGSLQRVVYLDEPFAAFADLISEQITNSSGKGAAR